MFGKVFASTYNGSMMGAGFHVFALWPYILATCDSEGWVEVNPKLVSVLLGGPVEQVEAALTYLLNTDPYSRSLEEEGRRLTRGGRPFLFQVVNYKKYRDMRDEEARKEQNREAAQKFRDKQRISKLADVSANPSTNTPPSASVSIRQHPSAQAEAEAEAEVKTPSSRGGVYSVDFQTFWDAYPRKEGKKEAYNAWKKLTSQERTLSLGAVVTFSEAWKLADEERKQFIPHPATWINKGRWADDPSQWMRDARGGNGRLVPEKPKDTPRRKTYDELNNFG